MRNQFLIYLALSAAICTACGPTVETEESAQSGTGGTGGTAQTLPDTFGDCDARECEVSLKAFSNMCAPNIEAELEALSCENSSVVAGTCGELYGVSVSLWVPGGDGHECIYDADTGELVGATWMPDAHPKQVAGTLLPDSCELTEAPCETDEPNRCGDTICEEKPLESFTDHPGTIPYCEGTLTDAMAALACAAHPDVAAGTCDGLREIRYTYGFPGDNYTCIYDESSDALVGATWTPDSHPKQVAGTLTDESCELDEVLCEGT